MHENMTEKTLFVVSDIHGHYTEMKKALESAGFREDDNGHVFVSCGDLFDRGTENQSVYAFVKRLKNKILLRGNHEDMLLDILCRGYLTSSDMENEADKTVSALLGKNAVDEGGRFDRELHAEKIADLTAFIEEMSDYYETETHVLSHGWLPIVFEGRYPTVDPHWRAACAEDWRLAHEQDWQHQGGEDCMLPGGHLPDLEPGGIGDGILPTAHL